MRVLVVDDDVLNSHILASVLSRRRHDATVVHSGEEALEVARKSPPDLVVTDVFMPGMDGFRLCMKWRRDPALRSIPLVFYTAVFTSPADKAFATRLGAQALLTKPTEPQTLLDWLEAAAATGPLPSSDETEDEFTVLREYTDRVVERLEAKVTELNEANNMLLQATEMQSALVDCAPVGIALMDRECELRLWSPAAERIFGWTGAEVVGVFNPLLHGDGDASTGVRALLGGGATLHNIELPRQRSDGTRFVMSLSAARVMDAAGEPSGIVAMFTDVTDRNRSEAELLAAVSDLEKAMDGSVQVVSTLVEKRDPYTAGHQERVADLAVAIGHRMGLEPEVLRRLRTAASLHDVGKISVPTEILTKPGRLTLPEWEMIKVHPAVGVEILQAVDFGWPLADVVAQHHERLDGSGYPKGLKGDEIVLEARILAVADVVEAMSSHRPYRAAKGVDEALAEVRDKSGRLYDPKVVDACVAVVEEQEIVL